MLLLLVVLTGTGAINVIVYKAPGDLSFLHLVFCIMAKAAPSIAVIIMMCDMQPARSLPLCPGTENRNRDLSLMMMIMMMGAKQIFPQLGISRDLYLPNRIFLLFLQRAILCGLYPNKIGTQMMR